ncbi:hypothetical protein FA15DRAFT_144573 [Coprinopsis marcescibilis]|uniref:Uncharacterized protein n=1 Tax=Coprinopsis marcescibilis TaxID=230819 RepID=A0A5C3KJH7_COPMA|nr:hypothetical protein FA15DRAFT_144573 [Coprinopsis marcescibilis]
MSHNSDSGSSQRGAHAELMPNANRVNISGGTFNAVAGSQNTINNSPNNSTNIDNHRSATVNDSQYHHHSAASSSISPSRMPRPYSSSSTRLLEAPYSASPINTTPRSAQAHTLGRAKGSHPQDQRVIEITESVKPLAEPTKSPRKQTRPVQTAKHEGVKPTTQARASDPVSVPFKTMQERVTENIDNSDTDKNQPRTVIPNNGSPVLPSESTVVKEPNHRPHSTIDAGYLAPPISRVPSSSTHGSDTSTRPPTPSVTLVNLDTTSESSLDAKEKKMNGRLLPVEAPTVALAPANAEQQRQLTKFSWGRLVRPWEWCIVHVPAND